MCYGPGGTELTLKNIDFLISESGGSGNWMGEDEESKQGMSGRKDVEHCSY